METTLETSNFKSKYVVEVSLHMYTNVVLYNICSKQQTDWVEGVNIVQARKWLFLNCQIWPHVNLSMKLFGHLIILQVTTVFMLIYATNLTFQTFGYVRTSVRTSDDIVNWVLIGQLTN